ncbi:hypothetical protein MMC10_001656 [Thelotrema lepadinum]|nr:hypothetical protein [Thelotrema lepadinum]
MAPGREDIVLGSSLGEQHVRASFTLRPDSVLFELFQQHAEGRGYFDMDQGTSGSVNLQLSNKAITVFAITTAQDMTDAYKLDGTVEELAEFISWASLEQENSFTPWLAAVEIYSFFGILLAHSHPYCHKLGEVVAITLPVVPASRDEEKKILDILKNHESIRKLWAPRLIPYFKRRPERVDQSVRACNGLFANFPDVAAMIIRELLYETIVPPVYSATDPNGAWTAPAAVSMAPTVAPPTPAVVSTSLTIAPTTAPASSTAPTITPSIRAALKAASNALATGSKALATGSTTLENALPALKTGSKALANESTILENALPTLKIGSKALATGLTALEFTFKVLKTAMTSPTSISTTRTTARSAPVTTSNISTNAVTAPATTSTVPTTVWSAPVATSNTPTNAVTAPAIISTVPATVSSASSSTSSTTAGPASASTVVSFRRHE